VTTASAGPLLAFHEANDVITATKTSDESLPSVLIARALYLKTRFKRTFVGGKKKRRIAQEPAERNGLGKTWSMVSMFKKYFGNL
jgi:hypothetical protein